MYMSGVHLDCSENVMPLIKTCQQNDDVVGLAYSQRADLCSLGVKPFFFFSFVFFKNKTIHIFCQFMATLPGATKTLLP